MKNWSFKVKCKPSEISKNLEASLGAANGFVFNIKNNQNDLVSFKIRKRLLYAWYILYHNNVVVKGSLSNAEGKGETNVNISFSQHLLWKFVIFVHLLLALSFVIAIFLGSNDIAMYVLAIITLAIGVFLWLRLHKKYERNIQEYKDLICNLL